MQNFKGQKGEGAPWTLIGIMAFALVTLLVAGGMYGCPQYSVYSSRLEGEAELAKANYSKQVAIQEANAKAEAAEKLAEAEITRARGVAKANEIIGGSLQGNDAYLHYLWIQSLHESPNQTTYIPTEAGFPIMEAGRNVRTQQAHK